MWLSRTSTDADFDIKRVSFLWNEFQPECTNGRWECQGIQAGFLKAKIKNKNPAV
jgi:hypothetical protein